MILKIWLTNLIVSAVVRLWFGEGLISNPLNAIEAVFALYLIISIFSIPAFGIYSVWVYL
jgi:membrane protein YdbS with pleckstrin-like domain